MRYGDHRDLHYPLRRQRQMCIRDRPTIDPENLNKIAIPRFEQISLKVGKKREKSVFEVRPLQWANVKILPRWSRNGAR